MGKGVQINICVFLLVVGLKYKHVILMSSKTIECAVAHVDGLGIQ